MLSRSIRNNTLDQHAWASKKIQTADNPKQCLEVVLSTGHWAWVGRLGFHGLRNFPSILSVYQQSFSHLYLLSSGHVPGFRVSRRVLRRSLAICRRNGPLVSLNQNRPLPALRRRCRLKRMATTRTGARHALLRVFAGLRPQQPRTRPTTRVLGLLEP